MVFLGGSTVASRDETDSIVDSRLQESACCSLGELNISCLVVWSDGEMEWDVSLHSLVAWIAVF